MKKLEEGAMISVVVPVFNGEQYVEDGVKALLTQTYPCIQIVLVDDGSTDSTGFICDRMAEQFDEIKVIHQDHQGAYVARVNGSISSDGAYLGFCDVDDEPVPDLYERLMANLIRENADISHCGYEMVENGKITKYYGTGKTIIQDRASGVSDLLEGIFVEPTLCTKLYRRELFDAPFFDARVGNYEDLLLNLQLFQRSNKSVYEDIVLYRYIRRENSSSRRARPKELVRDYIAILNAMDAISSSDKKIRSSVERRMASQWVSTYQIAFGASSELAEEVSTQIPHQLKAGSGSMFLRYWMVCHMPNIYQSIYKRLRRR